MGQRGRAAVRAGVRGVARRELAGEHSYRDLPELRGGFRGRGAAGELRDVADGAAGGRVYDLVMPEGVITVLAYPDSPGRVLLDSGEELRFGTGAVRDFTQRIGLRVHAEELEPYPLGGQRARRLDPLEKPERKQAARARTAAEEKRALDAAIARVEQLLAPRRIPACLEDWRALVRDALDASGLPRAVQKQALARAKVGACLVPGAGKMRLGGVPRLPAGVAWPMTEKRPHTALAELHVAELPSTLDLPIPKDASVVLLYDPHVEHTEHGAGAAIISRSPLTEPGPAQWPELTFRAVEVLTLPAADGPELGLSGDDYVLYRNLVFVRLQAAIAAPDRWPRARLPRRDGARARQGPVATARAV
jgi:hypothetical protein